MNQSRHPSSDNIGIKNPSSLPSLVGSVVVHGLIVVGVLFAHTQQKPLPKTPPLEASLVTGDDLMGAEDAIAEAFAKYQAQSLTQSTQKRQRSAQLEAYYDELTEREHAYQIQMQEYAKSLDTKILSQMQMQQQAMQEQRREREQAVTELKEREQSNDEIAKENSQIFNEVRERQLQKLSTQNRLTQKSLSDGEQLNNDTPTTPTIGLGGIVDNGNGGGINKQNNNRNAVIIALQNHIRSYWRATGKNQTLQVSLKVDSHGNVLGIQVSGGDDYLHEQLKDTISRASPLTPIIGTNYRQLNFNFNIN
ncbi:hypothetical protein MHK07_00160 [Moraxella nonliquefaciens]|uniref:hypothetical protein n=1 Tax=Moraxella nonliquefaciens TaxID=478 RepID=UPI001EF746B2|nr:hypothetical protein [Moraxella nonliquefaciens]MCG7410939.1 hypothetical protein [Moraxella nonliquefaciens]